MTPAIQEAVLITRAEDSNRRAYRLSSIDVVRGLVIVIMAIDHVRDYFNIGGEVDPMANPRISAALFFGAAGPLALVRVRRDEVQS